MARQTTARRGRRPVEAPDDTFVAGVLETSVWAKRHSRILISATIVLAILIAGFVWWRFDRETRRSQAATALGEVRQAALTGNFALAARDLEAFLVNYDGTPASHEARVLLAQSYLELGQPQRAIDAAARLARDPREPLGATAGFLVAAAHEAVEQSRQAEEVYLRIADRGRFLFQRVEALDNAARIRLQRGDPAGAAELYDRVVALIPEEQAADRGLFEMRAAEARAQAMTGTAAAATPAPAAAVPADPDADPDDS